MVYKNLPAIKITIDLNFAKQTTANSTLSPNQTISNSKAPENRRCFSHF